MATAPHVQPDPDLQTGLQYLRAGWFDRAYTQFSAIFELTELYHVGFEPQGFTAEALKPVEG